MHKPTPITAKVRKLSPLVKQSCLVLPRTDMFTTDELLFMIEHKLREVQHFIEAAQERLEEDRAYLRNQFC